MPFRKRVDLAEDEARSIRARLVYFVLSILIPAVLLSVAGHIFVYRSEQVAIERTLRETVRALALVVDREMARREAVLTTLAAAGALEREDYGALQAQASEALASGEILVVLTPEGREVYETPSDDGDRVPEDVWLGATDFPARRTFISNAFRGPSDSEYRYAIRRAVLRDDVLQGYLAVASPVQHFQAILVDQQLPEAWTGAILDFSGTLVARNRDPERHVGLLATPDVREKSAAAPSGFFRSRTRDGVATFAYFDEVPLSGWKVIIGVPEREVGRAAAEALWAVTAGSLVLLVVAIGLAVRVGRGIVEPMQRLERAATDLGRGQLVDPEPTGITEMDTVRHALAGASRQIREANAEMERRIREAVADAERTQQALLQAQKLEALGRLTGGIAHDFNNLLQTLRTGLQFAESSPDDPETRAVLQSCVRAVARATKLTRQLMAFGRHQGSAARSIDLRNQLLAMEDLLKSALSRDLSLRFEVVQDLWMVRVDAVLFEMALLNLVFNARDAIHGKGGVWICAENVRVQLRAVPGLPAGDFVRLAVRDNGEGMSTEVRTKAIDPFFTTKPAGKGSGLGLSQVYGFVQQSQGGLTLDSEPGRGTTVTMYLPRTAELPVEFSEEHPASRSPVPSEHLKVLVVEDDVLVRDVVVPALTGCGFTVVTATHGEEALERLDREHDIQVVFSDIVMPGRLNGVELAQEVNRRWPHLPVVLATGYAEHAGDAATPWRTLPKPYDIGAVAAELRTAVRTHRSS